MILLSFAVQSLELFSRFHPADRPSKFEPLLFVAGIVQVPWVVWVERANDPPVESDTLTHHATTLEPYQNPTKRYRRARSWVSDAPQGRARNAQRTSRRPP